MEDQESISIFNYDMPIIIKQFNEWEIKLISNFDKIILQFKKNYQIYEDENFFKNFKEKFKLYNDIENLPQLMEIITNNLYKIEEENQNLIRVSFKENKIQLAIPKKKMTEEMICEFLDEFDKLKLQNKNLEKRILNLQKINNINIKNNEILNNQLTKSKFKIKISEKILKKILHKEPIQNIEIFPSGNIISVSDDKSIKIYDKNFNIIQIIENAHDDSIQYVSIKNDNTFITCCKKYIIKIWERNIKLENKIKFEEKNSFFTNHSDIITQLIYSSNNDIFSCSIDKTVKVWKKNKKKYENLKTLEHNNKMFSILLLQQKNILISSGKDGTYIWDLNNFSKLYYLYYQKCYSTNGLKQLDDNRIIISGYGNGFISIISFNGKEIFEIKKCENKNLCWAICVIKEKGIFLLGDNKGNINIYDSENYNLINNTIKLEKEISDIIKINSDLIGINFNNSPEIFLIEL